ncbi:kinase-like protein [Calocera cornea HHB12733]|uniref:Kinase-like protein n=1 Tax=Calocera cornea HHB12733 TaxID=1353952 RepID=A0A165EIB0_9BASI|nr:kinase-like protein [Calocera cornea HHB12733]
MTAIISIVLPSSKYPISAHEQIDHAQTSVPNLTALINDISTVRAASGAHGDIWQASYRGAKVALKTMTMTSWSVSAKKERNHRLMNELNIWTELKHPNILELYGVSEREPYGLALVSPWLEHGDVNQYMKAYPGVQRYPLVLDIAQALVYMHSLQPPVVHGNLRSGNVLVKSSGQACVAGFSVSGFLRDPEGDLLDHVQMYPSSPRWMAPEQLFPDECGLTQIESFSPASDVYAFGMVAYEIFAEQFPFYHVQNIYSVPLVVKSGERPARPGLEGVDRGLSDDMWTIMQDCWRLAGERPDASELVKRVAAETGSST